MRKAAVPGSSIWPRSAVRSMTVPATGARTRNVGEPALSASVLGRRLQTQALQRGAAARTSARAAAAVGFGLLDLALRRDALGGQLALPLQRALGQRQVRAPAAR